MGERSSVVIIEKIIVIIEIIEVIKIIKIIKRIKSNCELIILTEM